MRKKKITKKDINKVADSYSKLSTTTKKIVVITLLLIVLVGIGLYIWHVIDKKNETVTGELSIHIMELGNSRTGDCIYIKAGDCDIIVDGGSRTNSVDTVVNYLDNYIKDDKVEYAIITHADQDHISTWAGDNTHRSLFDEYKVENIIDFPLTNKDTLVYQRYIESRNKEVANDGAKHYTALECYNNINGGKRKYSLSKGIELEILYNFYYEHTDDDENNYSVCFMINQGSNHYLFTGDLEKEGEHELIRNNKLPKCVFFKAGHHGSATSSTQELLNVIQPKYCAVSCVAGSVEYTHNINTTFPTQIFIDNISRYTENVFVTSCIDLELQQGQYENVGQVKSLNGTIVLVNNNGNISMHCTANNTLLKDTLWMKNYRSMPLSWQK